jgi:hypothetical protein
VVVPPPGQQRRRPAHGLGVHHLQKPHPRPPPRPRAAAGRNERSFRLHLSTGGG